MARRRKTQEDDLVGDPLEGATTQVRPPPDN